MKDADNLRLSNKLLNTEEMFSTLLSHSKEKISKLKEERVT